MTAARSCRVSPTTASVWGLSKGDYATLVMEASNGALGHVLDQKDRERTLARGWGAADDVPSAITDFVRLEPLAADDPLIEEDDPIEDLLLEMDGLLGAVMAYADRINPRECPTINGAAALAAVGACSARAWAVEVGPTIAPPTILGLLVAPSGAGKETVKNVFSAVAREHQHILFRQSYASDISLHQELATIPNHLVLEDEYGRYLASAQKAGDNRHLVQTKIMEAATSFWGGLQSHITRKASDCIPAVDHPQLQGLATTAPDPFYEALDRDYVAGGQPGPASGLRRRSPARTAPQHAREPPPARRGGEGHKMDGRHLRGRVRAGGLRRVVGGRQVPGDDARPAPDVADSAGRQGGGNPDARPLRRLRPQV